MTTDLTARRPCRRATACPDPREIDDLSQLCTNCLLTGLVDAIGRVNHTIQREKDTTCQTTCPPNPDTYRPNLGASPTPPRSPAITTASP